MDRPTPNRSAVETVLEGIRSLIADQGLVVGDTLPTEMELAKLYGTSRNTIREAISTLKAYGVIETRQRIGPVIVDKSHLAASKLLSFSHQISPDAFNDIQGFRRLVEQGIAEQVIARRTDGDLIALRRHNELMEKAEDIKEAAFHDYNFHLHLVSVAGNTTTVDVYRFLQPIMLKLLENGKAAQSARAGIGEEHEAIIDALVEQDRHAYVYLVGKHLQSGLKFIE